MELKISIPKYEAKVRKVIEEKAFIFEDKDESILRERINNGRRYFYIVLPRTENGERIDRFLKVPAQNSKNLLQPFARQIEIARYFKQHKTILTRDVVESEINPKKGIPFAIMETLPSSKIGFIEGYKGAELLNEIHAQKVISALWDMYAVNFMDLPASLRSILKKFKGDYKNTKKDILKYLNKKVKNHLDGSVEEPFYKIIERRLNTANFKRKALELLERVRPIIFSEENAGQYLVHGDMAPNNLYIYDNNDVELLDLEWAGVSENKAMSMVFDYGNLRARAWNNNIFRNALDEKVLSIYRNAGKPESGKAIVSLGILRSHLMLSGFFENYDKARQILEEEKMRREITENDIRKAWQVLD